MKTCANSAVLKSARTSGPRVAWTKRNYCTLSRDAVKPRVVSKGCTCARPERCGRDLRDVLQGCGWSECKEGAGELMQWCFAGSHGAEWWPAGAQEMQHSPWLRELLHHGYRARGTKPTPAMKQVLWSCFRTVSLHVPHVGMTRS